MNNTAYCYRIIGLILSAWITLTSAPAAASNDMQLERVILLYRHGVRTPLPGEIQANEVTGQPWPAWLQAPSELTPHGAMGAVRMGAYDRKRLAADGLFPPNDCPAPSSTWFWANTDQRTIASAKALAEGFAPGCAIAIGHLRQGSEDPLFHPIEAGTVAWSARDAVASIQSQTGGPDSLTARHKADLNVMASVLGCKPGDTQPICDSSTWHGVLVTSPDHDHMVLTGPIATTSGTAEVILMAYAEGRSLNDVGWGRTDDATLEQLSRLHSLLFDIYARPSYMAERVASVMSKRIASTLLDANAPRLSVMVGSDNNIVALASVLGIHFKMPSYGQDDPPIGGALGIELWRHQTTGRRYVRIVYQAQTLSQLRSLKSASDDGLPATLVLQPASCASSKEEYCPLEKVIPMLEQAAAHIK
ncbi:histidine-type phosphatase [Dyella sp. 20L07]|uniref:histidine-type phosphatase n=1 Tax=Dyella sp. 20L07 TaxID=3384240 RepID=UPI003D26E10B